MNKKVLRNFVEQFGKEWECSCKEPFKIENLEIISETETSLIAHYVCPGCSVEQMLAASISEEKDMLEQNIQTLTINSITSDDVLDIREEIKNIKLSNIRAMHRSKVKKDSPVVTHRANQNN
jgi:hypothetical protein